VGASGVHQLAEHLGILGTDEELEHGLTGHGAQGDVTGCTTSSDDGGEQDERRALPIETEGGTAGEAGDAVAFLIDGAVGNAIVVVDMVGRLIAVGQDPELHRDRPLVVLVRSGERTAGGFGFLQEKRLCLLESPSAYARRFGLSTDIYREYNGIYK